MGWDDTAWKTPVSATNVKPNDSANAFLLAAFALAAWSTLGRFGVESDDMIDLPEEEEGGSGMDGESCSDDESGAA